MSRPPSTVKLKEVARFIRGVTFKPDDVVPPETGVTIGCMRTKNVQNHLDLSDVWSISPDLVNRAEQYLRPGDTLVSMNFFGFTPRFLDVFWEQFPAFLDEKLSVNPEKCEIYLPSVVSAELQSGSARVRLLPCHEIWHGVTYHDDLPSVVSALAELRRKGVYPERLRG